MSKRKIVLILGGARSGKTDYALRYCDQVSGKKAYLATAQAFDKEMEERITKHRESRPKEYTTLEEPRNLTKIIQKEKEHFDAILLDCLTLWTSNMLEENSDREIEDATESFLEAATKTNLILIIVSNEVGMSIVPENALARRFRDLSGALNQLVAQAADEVYLVTAGLPMRLK